MPQPEPLRAGVRAAVTPQGPPPPPQGAVAPPGAAPVAGPPDAAGASDEASPQEQDQYERVLNKALRYLRAKDSDVRRQMKPLRGESQNDALGRVVATTLRQIDQSATKAGEELSSEAVFQAASDLSEQVAELAVAAKLIKPPKDQKEADRIANEIATAAANDQIRYEKSRGNPMQKETTDFVTGQVAQEVDQGAAEPGFLSKGQKPGAPQAAPAQAPPGG